MPWPEKQRRAIFLSIERKKGKKAARKFMHEHGYGGKDDARAEAVRRELKRRSKRSG